MSSDWEGKADILLKWTRGEECAPYTLEIHPTYRCNLHCVFCKQEYARQKALVGYAHELNKDKWLNIIDDAAELGVREVRICGGGEPMYDPNVITPIIKRIKMHRMAGNLTTNGTIFNNEIARMLVETGWERLEVSIDGATKETHEALRGVPGCFDRTVQAVEWICEEKARGGKDLPRLVINMVVNARNFHEIPMIIERFGPMGVNELLLLNIDPGGLAGYSLLIPDEAQPQLLDKVREAIRLSKRHGMNVATGILAAEEIAGDKPKEKLMPYGRTFAEAPLGSEAPVYAELEGDQKVIRLLTSPCYEPWYYLQILHDGKYSPCCNAYFNRGKEDFHKLKLKKTWLHGPHMRKVRDNLLNGLFEDNCKNCDMVHLVHANEIRTHLLDLCEKRGLLPTQTIRTIRHHYYKILGTKNGI